MDILQILVGYILIWWAVEVGRKEDSKIELFSAKWILQILLIAFGVMLIKSIH